jgi:hypothetical protein
MIEELPKYYWSIDSLSWFDLVKFKQYLATKGLVDKDIDNRIKFYQSHKHTWEWQPMERQFRCANCAHWGGEDKSAANGDQVCYGYNYRGDWK